MVIGTFDGADIIKMPAAPGIRTVDWVKEDTASVSSSPWNGEEQVQWYPADRWSGTLVLPQMDRKEIAPWDAFLAQLRGMKNVFWLGDPMREKPLGLAGEFVMTPVINGAAAAQGTALATRGWPENGHLVLRSGDHVQIGTYLHMVLDDVSSDADGLATLSLWPILREAVTDGAPLVTRCPRGLFRLAENKRTMSVAETRLGAITFKVREARKNNAS